METVKPYSRKPSVTAVNPSSSSREPSTGLYSLSIPYLSMSIVVANEVLLVAMVIRGHGAEAAHWIT